ncbi:MAG: glycosyltransferase [Candidatus Pacebacteria bacterium]|nr:glycosyltransferase [Candidatus Paceibacterota bacterium]
MRGFYFVNTNIENKRAHTFQILNTAEFLRRSFDLALVFPEYRNDYDKKNIFSYYGLTEETSVIFKRVFGIKRSCLLAFLLFDISASYFLFVQKIKNKPDFIYLRSSFFLSLSLAAFFLRIPIFYETHRKPISRSEKIRDYFLSKCASGFVVISKGLETYYSKYNKPVLVIHDAVSLGRFDIRLNKDEARQKLGISSPGILGVYCGSVRKIKGIDVIFSAAKKMPNVNFEIVGPVYPEFKNLEISFNVHLAGSKSQEKIPTYLKAADFLILPHPESEYSQSPMKLFEYLAVARPIISSDTANIKEVLVPEGNLFFKSGSDEDFVLAIKKYIAEKETYDKKAINNKEISREYTWEKRGEKIARFMRLVLNKQ